MNMRLLFLDFDGVLHPVMSTHEPQFCRLPLLESLLRKRSDLRVVITSNWRETRTLEQLRKPFSGDLQDRVIGMTPVLHRVLGERWTRDTTARDLERHVRFLEVEMWMRDMGHTDARWAALDDVAGFYPSDCDRLVRCDPDRGLSECDLVRLEALLW
jgi:hypothetical protein